MKPNTESQLCAGCGLCCDGSIFANATVEPGEEERMLAAGLELFDEDESRHFRQPCPHSECGRCMIYETRFEICRSFQCSLLKAVKNGELPLSEAKEKVALAKQLLERADAAVPGARFQSDRYRARQRLAKEISESSGEQRAAISRRLLPIIALDAYFERWFRKKKKKQDEKEERVKETSE